MSMSVCMILHEYGFVCESVCMSVCMSMIYVLWKLV